MRKRSAHRKASRIHPVVIYPFAPGPRQEDLEALFELVASLDQEKEVYARPITVIDRKTHRAGAGKRPYDTFRQKTLVTCSDVVDAWCVDTCQMWYTGLALAFERGAPGDVYWLIPGDFNYGTPTGRQVLGRLHDLPEIVVELEQDLCIGEIATDHNHSKQLIDNYGTFALLYTWFPQEAVEIRQFTERPRSEFLAVRHGFLEEVLNQRWYAYEQTVMMLLQAVLEKKRISRFFVGDVSDVPGGREPFASAIQQVERTERVLKSVWRERNHHATDWRQRYRELDMQSEQVRRTALTILGNLLGDKAG